MLKKRVTIDFCLHYLFCGIENKSLSTFSTENGISSSLSDDQMMEKELIHVPGSQMLFIYSMGMFVLLTVLQLKQHR